jgi:hypothetical protein
MDAPTCTLCGFRHWSGQSCKWPVGEEPKKIAAKKAAAWAPKLDDGGQIEKVRAEIEKGAQEPGIVTGYNFAAAAACPECAMRKAKKAEQMRRYREKREAKR